MRGLASEFSRDILDVHGILQARVAPLEQELEKLQAENASLRAEIVRLHGERDEVAQITKQITLVTASMLDQHICLDGTVENAEADAPERGTVDGGGRGRARRGVDLGACQEAKLLADVPAKVRSKPAVRELLLVTWATSSQRVVGFAVAVVRTCCRNQMNNLTLDL